MNTWRDIKTDPPKPGWPVYATDGVSVCIGRIRRPETPADWETFTFDGYNIPEGYPLQGDISLFGITEWQPAPATFRPEKTADEMFREMGYEPVESGYLREYRKTEPNGNKIRICVAHGNNMQMTCEGKAFWMIADEVLACAQLIKEMEADNA